MMMNQTQKRLQIIKLAISITDIETIQLQVAKLRLLEGDEKIEEIVSKLDAKSFAQAQQLITEYIDTPVHKIHQRVTSEDEYTLTEKELIEKFDLFVQEEAKNDDTNYIDDIETFNQSLAYTQSPNYEALFKLDTEDVLKDNISIEFTQTENNEDDFFAIRKNPKALETEDISKDTFFDNLKEDTTQAHLNIHETSAYTEELEEDTTEESSDEETFEEIEEDNIEESLYEETIEEIKEDTTEELLDEESIQSHETVGEPSKESSQDDATKPVTYKPLSSIKERFHTLSQQYPPMYRSEHPYPSVHACLMSITYHSYTNDKIYKILENALKLAQSTIPGNKAEAGELILLSSVTEVKFAKLIFARELYKGKLFEQNIPDAFDLISKLADEEYPEALCDLGQFYEHGIGTAKNRKKAKQLYKKSMHYGVKRAKKHYERLTSGLFSFSS